MFRRDAACEISRKCLGEVLRGYTGEGESRVPLVAGASGGGDDDVTVAAAVPAETLRSHTQRLGLASPGGYARATG